MADEEQSAGTSAPARPGVRGFLARRYGPLPVWGWSIAALGAGFVAWKLTRGRGKSYAPTDDTILGGSGSGGGGGGGITSMPTTAAPTGGSVTSVGTPTAVGDPAVPTPGTGPGASGAEGGWSGPNTIPVVPGFLTPPPAGLIMPSYTTSGGETYSYSEVQDFAEQSGVPDAISSSPDPNLTAQTLAEFQAIYDQQVAAGQTPWNAPAEVPGG